VLVDTLTWSLARQCRPGDVLITGVGTPLAIAAGMLARELLVPDLTLIIAGSVDPATHDVAAGMIDPAAVARVSKGTLRQVEILDCIERGVVTLQFVAPAQVDGLGRINTSRVGSRLLPGPLALPDTSVLVGRLVAYRADHSPRFLASEVDYVTGAAGVATVLTGLAEIAMGPPTVVGLQPGASLDDVVAGCGFELLTDGAVALDPVPNDALALLRDVIDPHGVRGLELREGRAAALATLAGLASAQARS
jgi:acyl CoA:acetate/3-ketoacid CoA transferase beta subunit